MKYFLYLLFLSFISCQFTTKPKDPFCNFIGTWKRIGKTKVIYETWRRINETELAGKSYYIENGDTIITEEIQLLKKEDTIFYTPTVFNQNEGKPIPFQLTIGEIGYLFENPAHDFPQWILYQWKKDSMFVEIGTIELDTSSIEKTENFVSAVVFSFEKIE